MWESKQYKNLQIIDSDGFIWKGERFGFDKIRHLFFCWTKVVAEADKAYLTITLFNKRTITISFDTDAIISTAIPGRNKDIDSLKKLYLYLCARSFENRLKHYLSEVDQKGYFTYDGCRFNPKEKVIYFRDKPFHVASNNFFKGGGHVEIKKKGMTRMEKFKREFSLHPPQFNIQTDSDVIFILLDKFFGLRWKD